MTTVVIDSGICGFSATVKVEKKDRRRVKIKIETDCEMVNGMLDEISELELRQVFTSHLNNPVYRSAAIHLKHVACPVPAGILKAVEVELELCLPKDASIRFKD